MTGALLLALSSPLLGSCVADSVSLRVSCILSPETDCTYMESSACYLYGRMNLGSTRERYKAVLRVSNGLKSRARDVPPQSEPNGVTVREVEVEITDSAGRKPALSGGLPNPFTVQATGDVEPGEDAPVGGELLPAPYFRALKALSSSGRALSSVQLSIIVRGKTWGDVEVESASFPWNIELVTASERPENQECVVFDDDVCTLGQDKWGFACNPVYTSTDT